MKDDNPHLLFAFGITIGITLLVVGLTHAEPCPAVPLPHYIGFYIVGFFVLIASPVLLDSGVSVRIASVLDAAVG